MSQLFMKQFCGYTGKLVESGTNCFSMQAEVPHFTFISSVHALSD
jgi:hypothetical protein